MKNDPQRLFFERYDGSGKRVLALLLFVAVFSSPGHRFLRPRQSVCGTPKEARRR